MLSDEELQSLAPFPVVRASGDKVSETWNELRQRPGVAPVLMGNREAVGYVLKELGRNPRTAQQVAEEAARLDLDGWLAERVRSRPDHFDVAKVDKPWDGAPRIVTPFIPSHDHRGRPYEEVFFGLMPVEAPWLVPTHLRTSGWGDCPDAAVHTAIYKRWYERHGAVVSTIADGVVEFHVDKPVSSPEAAHALAVEQFIYCPDVIYQGVLSIGNLAAALQTNTLWYFWWSLGDHVL